jgi:hypothetical protein
MIQMAINCIFVGNNKEMHTGKYFGLILLFLMVFSGCRENKDEISNADVDSFVNYLMSEKYSGMSLPDFQGRHIPALLKYSKSTQAIHNYPRNPISSFYMPDVSLGMICLWTIESIRLKEANEHMFFGFPSLNCVFKWRNQDVQNPVDPAVAQSKAAEAYQSWWNKNKSGSFSRFCKIDPLEKTDYQW